MIRCRTGFPPSSKPGQTKRTDRFVGSRTDNRTLPGVFIYEDKDARAKD